MFDSAGGVRQAHALHHGSIVVDAHCDTLINLLEGTRQFAVQQDFGHLDLPRLRQGGVKVQFFAAFVHPRFRYRAMSRVLEIIDVFYEKLLPAPGVAHVTSASDVLKALAENKVACLLTVEGGEALEGSLVNLRILHRLGVRALTLTWNGRNEIGDGVGEGSHSAGLSSFGRQVVAEMNRLGMIIDVSHLAEAGFWDVVHNSAKPFMASHSNSRQLCDHPRNLSDEQVRAIANAGGVIGLTFVPDFVDQNKPCLERLLDHVDHLIKVGGEDCLGLGSDFDGFEGALDGLEDVSRLKFFTEGLFRRGYKTAVVEKILGGNFMRLIKDTLG
ncbi:MAG: dipeptidase [Bacillota bacterium]